MDCPRRSRLRKIGDDVSELGTPTLRTRHCACLPQASPTHCDASNPWPHESREPYPQFAQQFAPGSPSPLPSPTSTLIWDGRSPSIGGSATRSTARETIPAPRDFLTAGQTADALPAPASPKKPASLSVRERNHSEQLREWLKALRLHKYHNCLVDIEPEDLFELDKQTMETIGIDTVGARTKLFKVLLLSLMSSKLDPLSSDLLTYWILRPCKLRSPIV